MRLDAGVAFFFEVEGGDTKLGGRGESGWDCFLEREVKEGANGRSMEGEVGSVGGNGDDFPPVFREVLEGEGGRGGFGHSVEMALRDEG